MPYIDTDPYYRTKGVIPIAQMQPRIQTRPDHGRVDFGVTGFTRPEHGRMDFNTTGCKSCAGPAFTAYGKDGAPATGGFGSFLKSPLGLGLVLIGGYVAYKKLR